VLQQRVLQGSGETMQKVILVGCLLLAGCATTKEVVSVTDSFCLTARKRLWSVQDSPETIRDARAWNEAIDRRCASKKSRRIEIERRAVS
jgi:uncharacterized lipoprotein YajG